MFNLVSTYCSSADLWLVVINLLYLTQASNMINVLEPFLSPPLADARRHECTCFVAGNGIGQEPGEGRVAAGHVVPLTARQGRDHTAKGGEAQIDVGSC